MKSIFTGGMLVWTAGTLLAGTRDAQWKKVEDALEHGLPRTAITNLEPIITGALRDGAYAEATKAVARKITLEAALEGGQPEARIFRLTAQLGQAPAAMKPMLETLLAHWYWQYFQRNRWRFMQRTATAQPPGEDLTTWDLPRIYAQIDRHFQNGLAAEQLLKQTPIAAWGDLLHEGVMPDAYRPTLYDFIAHEALGFYASGEQGGAKPEDSFNLAADSPVFEAAERFLAWKPKGNSDSPTLRAIELYQALLGFHAADARPELALADADLDRLTWGWEAADGEDKDTRYKAALDAFIRRYDRFEISALARERAARALEREGNLAAAHEIAQRGAAQFPKSPGGELCRYLVAEIENKSIDISTERVWNGFGNAAAAQTASPAISVRYRNVDAVYFRAIAYDWNMFLEKRHHRPEALSQEEQREILARTPVLEWSETLAPTKDFKEKTVRSPAPGSLRPGFYFIAASPSRDFGAKDNVVAMTDVWVSDLALITRQRAGRLEGFVLDAVSGEPVAGAGISAWHLDNGGNRVPDPRLSTDTNGFFVIDQPARDAYLLLVRDRMGRELGSAGDVPAMRWQRGQEVRPEPLTVFFTDRAIYRPGQTIQYKGICLWVDQARDNYEVLKGETVTVVFKDANGKEVARQEHVANDYGSFAGSFTAPRDRLAGQMILQAEGRARGATVVRVEEYKRPKFEVTIEAPKTGAKLNETVILKGHATVYTGAAVDDAPVQYRVVRQVRWPAWGGWWHRRMMPPPSPDQVIAHGTARTGADGSFQIQFVARPDLKVPEKDEPKFVFSITADVTDNAGETRSAERRIQVGYTAMSAALSAPEWLTDEQPVEIKVLTQSLDEEPLAARGRLKIFGLAAPAQVQRAPLGGGRFWPTADAEEEPTEPDLSDPNHWPLGEVVAEQEFATGTNGVATLGFKLGEGAFRAVLESRDRFGKPVTARLPLLVVKPEATRLSIKVPRLLEAPAWELQPGQEFAPLWGTGYENGRAFVEIEQRHQIIQRYWTRPGQTQQRLRLAVTEAMRGGFTLHVTQVRENRAYLESRYVGVPWEDKALSLRWEHFVSKLEPGKRETWTAVVEPPKDQARPAKEQARSAEQVAAEMVATLYDESLDAFVGHDWMHQFGIFRQDQSDAQIQFGNVRQEFRMVVNSWRSFVGVSLSFSYRSLPQDLVWGYPYAGAATGGGGSVAALREAPMAALLGAPTAPGGQALELLVMDKLASNGAASPAPPEESPGGGTPMSVQPKPDLAFVSARKNLNETAFFFPHLTSDSDGIVRMTFTMPEALTRWRFLGFAHDRLVRSGFLEGHAVTAKELMVQPNPPRFLREGDTVEFTVKVSNQSDARQTGSVRLTFNELLSGAPEAKAAVPSQTDRLLGNTEPDRAFDVPARQSRSVSWRIHVPDGCDYLAYKAVGAAGNVSDGEEGSLPVLSRRVLVTESLPLPIRGPATKRFTFTNLVASGKSKTLRSQSLTAQMTSNPAWYAVLALPYLMEYPHECSEQTFNRLYADALARFIANRDPRIRRVFDQWKNTAALDSPLEKNQDVKAVMIEETPWLRQAQAESQARRNVGILFDQNRLDSETQATLERLAQMQLADGSWPWFPGGRGSDYMTLYIATGFGRLRHLGVDVPMSCAFRSLQHLDAQMRQEHARILKAPHPEHYVPSATDALWLYGRSFFLKDLPVPAADQPALDFFLGQARKFWLKTECRQTQGHLAIALKRFGDFSGGKDPTPLAIMNSLKERSVTHEEMGRFWNDAEPGWWWFRAPIETQAIMVEAFDEVTGDFAAVEDCRVWLLKQKQTQDWKTTKATADAVYALLLRGKDLLASDTVVELKLDGVDVTPRKAGANLGPRLQPEPGTGFYERRFGPVAIKPALGQITVRKLDAGVAWGSVHWQYLEDLDQIKPYEGTPLKLRKTLYTKTATARGLVLELVNGPVHVGDELVVRIELRVDRDMEFVHLKDQRGSGVEPLEVLSQYRYREGLAYYETTRDTASHFFIDYLPKGAYIIEYSARLQLRGEYQTGPAEIQCMYAPEFNSHSRSVALTVK